MVTLLISSRSTLRRLCPLETLKSSSVLVCRYFRWWFVVSSNRENGEGERENERWTICVVCLSLILILFSCSLLIDNGRIIVGGWLSKWTDFFIWDLWVFKQLRWVVVVVVVDDLTESERKKSVVYDSLCRIYLFLICIGWNDLYSRFFCSIVFKIGRVFIEEEECKCCCDISPRKSLELSDGVWCVVICMYVSTGDCRCEFCRFLKHD